MKVIVMNSFDIAILSVFLMLSPVILSPCCATYRNLKHNPSFSLTAAASFAAVVAGILAVHAGWSPTSAVLQMGLPDLRFHLRLDPLSGFFLCVIGLLALFVSIYSIGYVKGFAANRSVVRFVIFYSLFYRWHVPCGPCR